MPATQFSVVIPCYNGAPYVAEAIRSVFAQTLLPAEIIVVDDCSTDATCQVIESLLAESPVPLRLIRLERNSGGPAHPINVGVAAATGEYIAVLDQDDVFAPDRLETHARALKENPDATAALSWCADFAEKKQVLQWPSVTNELITKAEPRGTFRYVPSDLFFRLLLREKNFIFGYPGFSFRRRDWREKGGVDESLRIVSDYELLLWLANRGPAVLAPSVGYCRRFHEGNLTLEHVRNLREVHHVRLRAFRARRELFPREPLGAVFARAQVADLRCLRGRWCYKECFQHSWCLLGVRGARWRFLLWHLELPLHFIGRLVKRMAKTARTQ